MDFGILKLARFFMFVMNTISFLGSFCLFFYFCFVTCFVIISETEREWLREKGGGGRKREKKGISKERKKPLKRGL